MLLLINTHLSILRWCCSIHFFHSLLGCLGNQQTAKHLSKQITVTCLYTRVNVAKGNNKKNNNNNKPVMSVA